LLCASSSIIFARSPTHLKALTEQFKLRNGKSLTNQIKQHFSGHLQEALLFAVEGGKRDGLGIWRDAKRLHQAMKGAGTADLLLLTRLVRAHWDANRFGQIKLAFKQKYQTGECRLNT
jgi:annexin A7/11